jgi:hypothetical protein
VSSPTRRSLEHLRKAGAELVAVVERWNPHAKIRQDLFGVVDVLAIHGEDTIAVQATSRPLRYTGNSTSQSFEWLTAPSQL